MAEQFVNYSVEEGVATIVINNPPVNALSSSVMVELDSAIEKVKQDPSVKAVVLTGAGTFFVAGADIKEISEIKNAKEGEMKSAAGQAVVTKLENLRIPVIAAINGICPGGGNELAMACHIRIASERAKFGQPEINLGIIPGFGGTQRLIRISGPAAAAEILLSGDMITAAEARQIGLVNKVVPETEVLKYAKGLAKKIASKGKVAINSIMDALHRGLKVNLDEGLKIEAELFGKICETADMKEGLAAFIQKRQPKFSDK